MKIKIMLADLVMPGIDGIELMKEARKIVPSISTVIITAYGSIQSAIDATREGAHDYVEKPFCPEKVELLIRNMMEHQDLLDENISLTIALISCWKLTVFHVTGIGIESIK